MKLMSDLLILIGVAVVGYGVWTLSHPFGLVFAGVVLSGFGGLLGTRARKGKGK